MRSQTSSSIEPSFSSFEHGFGIDETVFGRTGLIKRRLGAKAAILRARAGLGVDDGAKMNLVAFEMLTKAISPRHQIKNVCRSFQIKKPLAFFVSDLAVAQSSLA
jgi:hypothetical protein